MTIGETIKGNSGKMVASGSGLVLAVGMVLTHFDAKDAKRDATDLRDRVIRAETKIDDLKAATTYSLGHNWTNLVKVESAIERKETAASNEAPQK